MRLPIPSLASPPANPRRRRVLPAGALLGAALLAALLAPTLAQARPESKYTLGVGLAGSSVKGDLDGKAVASDDPTVGPNAYLAKPDAGGGLFLSGGWQFSPRLMLEALLISTRHDAKHTAYPGENFQTHISALLAALRANFPLGERAEVFGRVGAGSMSVDYADNTVLPPNSLRLSSNLSGLEIAVGGGVALFFDPLGAELSVLHERGRLPQLKAAEQNIKSFRQAYVTRNTVSLALTMHFRGGP